MIITIEHIETLSGSPAMNIAIEGWANLVERGLMDHSICLLGWNNKAFLARSEEGEIVGVLVYTDVDWEQKLGVILGYVRPDYRKQNVYRKLWDAIVEKAQEKGRPRIEGATNVRNEDMQAVMDRLGRKASHIIYQYEVPKKEPV